MPLAVRRTDVKTRVEAPLLAAAMAGASGEWVGCRMPVWRDSAAHVQSRSFESTMRCADPLGR